MISCTLGFVPELWSHEEKDPMDYDTMNIRILTWTMIPITAGFVPELWSHEYKEVYLDYDAMNSRIFIEQFNFSQQLLL